jgi:probable aminopeptidase NPEPL1
VTTISFSASLKPALRGKQLVALFASKAALKRGAWKHVFDGKSAAVLKTMIKDASPGVLGRVVSSYTGGTAPARVALAVLPDAVSRHASPARSAAIGECAGKIGTGGSAKATFVLCLDTPAHYLAAANAIGRAFPVYTNRSGKPSKLALTIVAIDRAGKAIRVPQNLGATVDTTRWAAGLVDRPTAELTTADFVSESRKALRGISGVTIKTIVGKELLKKKLGAIHGVGRAAEVSPRLLIAEYRPRGAKVHVAIVGKGVVYDTGGLNIKTGGSMFGMKGDMGGGAAAIGAFKALVTGKTKHRVTCLVPLAENAVGPASYRPNDILHMHSGKTVEINNTDAEGRLLLADGVSYAARVIKADVIIDAATLTGAQLVATGRRHAAVVSNRAGLEGLAVASGLTSGDLAHPLPFAPEFFQAEFKSAVADMRNSVKDRANAQSSCAGQFVYSHIQDLNVPWLHIDLAGPAQAGKRATGFGVALISEVVGGLTASALKK